MIAQFSSSKKVLFKFSLTQQNLDRRLFKNNCLHSKKGNVSVRLVFSQDNLDVHLCDLKSSQHF